MKWTIPGTVLRIERDNADGVEEMFSSMFLAGGMVLSQVASITGLEPYTIQNWVKRGFLPPPQHPAPGPPQDPGVLRPCK